MRIYNNRRIHNEDLKLHYAATATATTVCSQTPVQIEGEHTHVHVHGMLGEETRPYFYFRCKTASSYYVLSKNENIYLVKDMSPVT